MTAALALLALLAQADYYDQSKVPLEAEPPDPSLAKIVLVAGKASHAPGHHEYFAGMSFFADMLRQTPGVHPVMVRDGWPRDPKIFRGAKSIVFYADGGKGHPLLQEGRMDLLQPLLDKGVGFAAIHYGVNFPAEASARILGWLGGHFDAAISSCPACTWTAQVRSLPEHQATRGVAPFALRDEWYFHMRFVPGLKGVTPLLEAVPPEWARTSDEARKHAGKPEVLAWAFVRKGGGRSFGYTGGHYHDNWGEENVRRLVTNGLLWTAGIEVPREGAGVSMKGASLSRNLDDKRKK
jgi:type 1 glutamine amidotransferase